MSQVGFFREKSIATSSFPIRSTIYQKAKSIKEAGFDSFELMETDIHEVLENVDKFKEFLRSIGLKISILQPFRDFEGSWTGFEHRLSLLEEKLILMKELDINLILLCTSCLPNVEYNKERYVKQFRLASKLAKSYGVNIALENLSWATQVNTLSLLWDLVSKTNMDNFGICLDSFHILMTSSDLNLIKKIGQKIFFVQLSDSYKSIQMPSILLHSRNYRYQPLHADFELVEFMRLVYEAGYDGTVSLELFQEPMKRSDDLGFICRESFASLTCLERRVLKGLEYIDDDQSIYGFEESSIDMNETLDLKPLIAIVGEDTKLAENGMITSKPMSKSLATPSTDLSINCSRLVFNSLSMYFEHLLNFKESKQKREVSSHGLPYHRVFTKGDVTVNIQTVLDELPIAEKL